MNFVIYSLACAVPSFLIFPLSSSPVSRRSAVLKVIDVVFTHGLEQHVVKYRFLEHEVLDLWVFAYFQEIFSPNRMVFIFPLISFCFEY